MDSVYSQRVRAGKRRTYFFDVKETRGNDYYLTITESRRKFNEDGYDRHKIFLYKEDFNKFLKGMTEAIDFVKTDLMPDFDFDIFSHENDENYQMPAPEIRRDIAQVTQETPDEKPEETSEVTETTASSESTESPTTSSAPEADDTSEDTSENGSTPGTPTEGNEPDNSSQQDEQVDKW